MHEQLAQATSWSYYMSCRTAPFCSECGRDEVPEFVKNLLKKMVNSNDALTNLSSELSV